MLPLTNKRGLVMARTSKWTRIVIAVVAAGTLAACGGGSDGDSSSGGEGGDSSSSGGDITVATVVNLPGVGDSCEKIINMIGALGQVMSGQIQADAATAIVDDFVAAVPAEIRSEADVVATAFIGYIDVLSKYDGNVAAAMADPEAMSALEQLNAAEMQESTDRLNAYLNDQCAWGG